MLYHERGRHHRCWLQNTIITVVGSRMLALLLLAGGCWHCCCWLEDARVVVVGCRMPVSLLSALGYRHCCCWLQYADIVIVVIVVLSLSLASALLSCCRCHYRRVILLSLSLPWSSAASQRL